MELSVEMLAFNTIAQSDFITEFDDASAMLPENIKGGKNSKGAKSQFGQEFDTDLDEFVTCAGAFA